MFVNEVVVEVGKRVRLHKKARAKRNQGRKGAMGVILEEPKHKVIDPSPSLKTIGKHHARTHAK